MRSPGVIALAAIVPWACVSAVTPSGSTMPEDLQSFELRPGVVVDRARDAVYLMRPGGSVEAVAIGSGESLWERGDAGRPLGVVGGRLLVQAEPEGAMGGVLALRSIDLEGPELAAEPLTLELPEDVVVTVDDLLESSFRAWLARDDGRPHIFWHYAEQRMSGRQPPEGVSGRRVVEGAALVDVEGKRLVAVEPLGGDEAGWPAAVERATAGDGLVTEPWKGGGVIAAVERSGESGDRLTLRRWDGESGEELAPGAAVAASGAWSVVVSGDGLHALVCDQADPPDGFRWSVLAVGSGQLIGAIPGAGCPASFFVANSTLVHEASSAGGDEGPLLRGVAVETGTARWERALRDTDYDGPYPMGRPVS